MGEVLQGPWESGWGQPVDDSGLSADPPLGYGAGQPG